MSATCYSSLCRWIHACITSAKRVPETDYDVDLLEQKRIAKLHEKDAAEAEKSGMSTSAASLPTPEPCKANQAGNNNEPGLEQLRENTQEVGYS